MRAFLCLVMVLIGFHPAFAFVHVVSTPNPIARTKMDPVTLEKIEKNLGANRWVSGARCDLKLRKHFVNKQFLKTSYKGDVLYLEFETGHLGPRKAWAHISLNSKWGVRLVSDSEYGPIEEVRIELDDTDGTWVQYRFDGTYLTQFEIGNVRGLTPCQRY